MAPGLKLGIDQIAINRHFKAAATGGHQADRLDFQFEQFQDVFCQTDSSVGVVSGCTVDQLDIHTHSGLLEAGVWAWASISRAGAVDLGQNQRQQRETAFLGPFRNRFNASSEGRSQNTRVIMIA